MYKCDQKLGTNIKNMKLIPKKYKNLKIFLGQMQELFFNFPVFISDYGGIFIYRQGRKLKAQ
jgi:hypothetical protein